MNHRVLELLKAPKNIQSEDLDLLKEEINSFPYVQNIRALYLYGVNIYDKENYQKVLSTTAAYTTDKKILYQLINGKIQQKQKPEIQAETIKEKLIPTENPLKILHQAKASGFPLKREDASVVEIQPETIEAEVISEEKEACILPVPRPEINHVYINGERNRILFEGEENFLEDENVETIDLGSTLESGSIVTQKAEKKEENIQQEDVLEEIIEPETISEEPKIETAEEIEEFTPETVIEEEKIESEPEKEEILDDSQTSFHETESSENQSDEVGETEQEIIVNETEKIAVVEETAEFTPEKIINEDKISSEKEEESVNDESELSFHGMESFLPEVKIQSNNSEEIPTEIPQSNSNKHEDEMRRLIEKVEKKMKEKAASEVVKTEEPENIGHDISFAETQNFEVKPLDSAKEEVQNDVVEELKDNVTEHKIESISEEQTEEKSSWKPMSFESHVPDSMINKSAEVPQSEVEVKALQVEETQSEEIQKQDEVLPVVDKIDDSSVENEKDIIADENEDVPVMNVSFFGSDISKWTGAESKKEEEKVEVKEEAQEVEIPVQNTNPTAIDSNIPGFINTWQSWLKIDRHEEEESEEQEEEEVEIEKVELKTKVIETFIENNPKISQLREESSYIVKEKNDDISHLMTETLANLYFEQKLYTKAIKAFEILIRKNPEKKEYFEGKIQEIKDFRSKG